jgi:hypothetical protein
MDCLTSEEIKSLPTQAFDAIKSYVPTTQTMALSVKEHYKPKVKKVEGSMVKGKTRIEKYKTGSFAHIIDPQNLSEHLRCYHVPTKILPRTASLLSTEANILRQEFYKETLLNGDAHGKLNSAIEQLYKHSEENGLQDEFSILPRDMVKRTFIPNFPSDSEVDADEKPYVPPTDPFCPIAQQVALEATQALIDAQTATTSDTNSNCDGDDNGGADVNDVDDDMLDNDDMIVSNGDDNDKSPANETVIATSTTKRFKKQRHSGGSPLTDLSKIATDSAFLRPQLKNLLWPKDWKFYDCGMFEDQIIKAQWPEGLKEYFQNHVQHVHELKNMTAKLLDIASRP